MLIYNIAMKIESIGKRIKKLRESYGITQKKLGEILGYSEARISYIESGKRPINKLDLHKIANIFKVSVDYFLSSPNISYSNHFRAEKTDEGKEIIDNSIMSDFEEYARKQIKQ